MPSMPFIINSVLEQLWKFPNLQKFKKKFKLRLILQLNYKEVHYNQLLIGLKHWIVSWTLTSIYLILRSVNKEDNLIQHYISYQDYHAPMIMLLKNQVLPDSLKNIELQLFSQIQVPETLVLQVLQMIGKLETQLAITLMLHHKNVNSISKCLPTSTNNYQNLSLHISLLAKTINQLQDLVWEVMVL